MTGAPTLTAAQAAALTAVRNGVVRMGDRGRVYPRSVSGNALSAAYRRGLWRWPACPPQPGDPAALTPTGQEALTHA